jgi:signal peptidase II
MLYSIVGLLVIILDQAVKFWVSDTLFGTDVVRFIPGVISLVNVHNDGAAFSFLSGSGARIYFIIATGVFVLLVIIALATNFIRGKFSRWCLVFVAAGGIGNMIDRIIYGYVQDMFKVELFNFAIFNVADVFITVFAILFALSMIFERPESDLNDVLYEVDDEEEKPKKEKKSRKEKKAEKLAALAAENEAAPEPAPEPEKKSKVRSARKSRQEKYEQEYEEYKAQQRAAMNKKAAPETPAHQPVEAPAPQAESAANAGGPDPFDAWVKANARAEKSEAQSYAGRLMDTPKPDARPAPAPQPKAAAPAPAPVKKPAPAPKPAPAEDEYNLDDILAEFK